MPTPLRLLLIAEDGPARSLYQERLADMGHVVDTVDSLEQMPQALKHKPHNGILVDLPTFLHADAGEREELHGLLDIFPVIRLRADVTSGVVRGLFYGQTFARSDVLEAFIDQECASFAARVIRSTRRAEVILPVRILHIDPQQPTPGAETPDAGTGRRSLITNFSEAGCFVLTTHPPEPGAVMALQLADHPDAGSLRLRVRWVVQWGTPNRLPGFGASFQDLSPAQRNLLTRLTTNGNSS